MAIKHWNAQRLIRGIEDPRGNLQRRLIKCGLALEREIKLSFGASGGGVSKKGATKAGRRSEPSEPGQPPHVDTGRLRAATTTNWTGSGISNAKIARPAKTSKSDDGVTEPTTTLTVRVGHNVEYGRYLELGTRKMAPRPHLRPAFDRLLPWMERLIFKGG